jgi:cytochrome c
MLCLAVLAFGLTGCGGAKEPATPAGAPAPEAPAPAQDAVDIDALLAGADIERGETLYFQCRACHTIEQGGANKVGPNLWGMFGRSAGQVPGFAYSDAVKNSGITWTPATLDRWLARPSEFLPGNMMVFVGIRKPEDRANLIAYLQAESARPAE